MNHLIPVLQAQRGILDKFFDSPNILKKKKAIAELTGIYPTNKTDKEIELEYFRLMEDPNNL